MKRFGELLRQSAIVTLATAFSCTAASAADLQAHIHKVDGTPVTDAVITLVPDNGTAPKPAPLKDAVMDQVHSTFVPHVLVVSVGTEVNFPNSDHIHHDVYSFSQTKTFELPLYKGVPAHPVLFDKPGIVVLGCNIHDWMLGYIDVVTSPWSAKTDETGRASIMAIPAGKYTVTVWQPDLDAPDGNVLKHIEVSESQPNVLDLAVTISPVLHSSAKP